MRFGVSDQCGDLLGAEERIGEYFAWGESR